MALEGYIADTDKVKQLGNLGSVSPEKLEPFFPQARKEVKRFLGKELYALFASGDPWAEDADYDDSDTELIQTAEAYMVLAYAVGPLNIDSSGAGFVKSTGFADGKKEILSEADITRLADKFRSAAEEILEDYLAAPDADEDENPDSVKTGGITMGAI